MMTGQRDRRNGIYNSSHVHWSKTRQREKLALLWFNDCHQTQICHLGYNIISLPFMGDFSSRVDEKGNT